MNKKDNIKNTVNTIGKVGKIITVILIVLSIIAAVCAVMGTVIITVLPKDSIEVTLSGTADVKLNGEFLNEVKERLVTKADEDGIEFGVNLNGTNVIIGDTDANEIISASDITETETGLLVNLDSQTFEVHLGRIVYAMITTLLYIICIIITLYMLKALMTSLEKCETPFNADIIKNIKKFGYSLIPFCVLKGLNNSAWGSIVSKSFDVTFSVELVMVLAVLVVFMLSVIFSYGAELQKESDETL